MKILLDEHEKYYHVTAKGENGRNIVRHVLKPNEKLSKKVRKKEKLSKIDRCGREKEREKRKKKVSDYDGREARKVII